MGSQFFLRWKRNCFKNKAFECYFSAVLIWPTSNPIFQFSQTQMFRKFLLKQKKVVKTDQHNNTSNKGKEQKGFSLIQILRIAFIWVHHFHSKDFLMLPQKEKKNVLMNRGLGIKAKERVWNPFLAHPPTSSSSNDIKNICLHSYPHVKLEFNDFVAFCCRILSLFPHPFPPFQKGAPFCKRQSESDYLPKSERKLPNHEMKRRAKGESKWQSSCLVLVLLIVPCYAVALIYNERETKRFLPFHPAALPAKNNK